MRHSLIIAALIAIAGICGCKGRQTHSWPLTYAMPAVSDAAADSVIRATDNRAFQITDSTRIVVMPGQAAFSSPDRQMDKVFNHFMRGGAVVLTSPKSGEWLHLWRRFEQRYDRLKAAGKLPADSDAAAVTGMENMIAEMSDVAGMDGSEKGMNFECRIARLIGFRGSDVYYQVVRINLRNLQSWANGTPSTDTSLLEQY